VCKHSLYIDKFTGLF